jgi:regulator of protease activity HflC (stomatin/prohibitin superfamily)
MQRLVTAEGAFIPNRTEEILQIQELIRVLPHEAVVVRDRQGQLTVHSGMSGDGTGTAFFLPPYSEIVTSRWSTYTDGSSESHQLVSFDRIDMRAHKNLFKYEVQTRDNVRLALEGTIFWQVRDVPTMISATSDPQGDLWHRARSALIEAVSNTTLSRFMSDFNGIVAESFRNVERDEFFSDRGVELQSMKVTSFSCADSRTGEILQEIIQETTNRINRLTVQESENEVRQAALSMDIQLERQRSELIQTRAENERLEAEMNGDAAGMRLMMAASTFIGGLNESVPNVTDRVDLYRMHQELSSRNADTQNLASGSAHLFLTPEDLKLRLTVGGAGAQEL